jgi:hypothetical protein
MTWWQKIHDAIATLMGLNDDDDEEEPERV